jgi:CheY-like chemotaxis protein
MIGTRIAVIDDDDDLRGALCRLLRIDGYDVFGFSDASEAIRQIEGGLSVNVILLDLMMPGMNGWEFCERRATSPVLARVPVIVITARQQVVPPVGVREMLSKPFEPVILQEAIARALASPEAADEQ